METVEALLQDFNAPLASSAKEELYLRLQDAIRDLLFHDFNRLVQLLYQVDIEERKLKTLLQSRPEADAAVLISDLLVERLEEKRKIRESMPPKKDIPEEDQW